LTAQHKEIEATGSPENTNLSGANPQGLGLYFQGLALKSKRASAEEKLNQIIIFLWI
jgi:hypothetical protein